MLGIEFWACSFFPFSTFHMLFYSLCPPRWMTRNVRSLQLLSPPQIMSPRSCFAVMIFKFDFSFKVFDYDTSGHGFLLLCLFGFSEHQTTVCLYLSPDLGDFRLFFFITMLLHCLFSPETLMPQMLYILLLSHSFSGSVYYFWNNIPLSFFSL